METKRGTELALPKSRKKKKEFQQLFMKIHSHKEVLTSHHAQKSIPKD